MRNIAVKSWKDVTPAEDGHFSTIFEVIFTVGDKEASYDVVFNHEIYEDLGDKGAALDFFSHGGNNLTDDEDYALDAFQLTLCDDEKFINEISFRHDRITTPPPYKPKA